MNVILNDEQTLAKWSSGLTLEVCDVEYYKANGFWYELHTLDCSFIDDELFIVRKCISETVYDTFVCYRPIDIEFGGREKFDFLFNEDDSYKNRLVHTDELLFDANLVGVDVTINIMDEDKPGKVTEYQTDDSQENPFIFVFEAINEDTLESFVSYVQGCRVNQKEVEFL